MSVSSKNKDRLFDSECVNAFSSCIHKESFMCLRMILLKQIYGDYSKKKQVLTGKHVKTLQTFLQILLIINLLLPAGIL